MREIKFRLILYNKIVGYEKWYPGKWNDNNRYWEAYPHWLYSIDNMYYNTTFIFHDHKEQYIYRVDEKNREIYEGDFVTNIYMRGVVVWSDESRDWGIWGTVIIHNWEGINIIGNIHDNPELLKEIEGEENDRL
ncbi:MAG: YopX family protein [Candidatus Nanoarchaeia archaeon]|nr:YopX family protein [Candidatus Nanoarchaeia archaeon]